MSSYVARLESEDDVAGWRRHARALLAANVARSQVDWRVGPGADLFASKDAAELPLPAESGVRVSRRFLDLCERALLHSDSRRFALCYRLLARLQSEPRLLDVASDPDVIALGELARSVRRDMHKMTAFVRFREIAADDGGSAFVACFEPDHHIVAATAPFFMRRFAKMRWSILTPKGSALWNGDELRFGPPASRREAPTDDALEGLWKTYYASIFNPARLKPAAMRAEMPKKYWRNLPEAELIEPLIASARSREARMLTAAPNENVARRRVGDAPAPEAPADPDELRLALAACRRCGLAEFATQPVAGQGPSDAALMLVGEQPGDEEDLKGVPFVGPAGRLLTESLREAGIDRNRVYVTNAVKHFKFEPRGKRRIHKKPDAREMSACRDWLLHEIAFVRPGLIVALGATAIRSLTGRAEPLRDLRGKTIGVASGAPVFATVHPSYLLRIVDPHEARAQRELFTADLKAAARAAEDR